MTKNTNVKTPEQIIEDLENISPLNMSEYIMECEFYDMQDAHEVFAEAVSEFEDKGGVASNLVEPVVSSTVNSVLMVGLRHFAPDLYKKALKGKLNLATIVKRAIHFQYPDEYLMLQANTQHQHADEVLNNQLRATDSGFSTPNSIRFNKKTWKDDLRKEWDSEASKDAFVRKGLNDDGKATDVLGVKVRAKEDGERRPADSAEPDHVLPLSLISDQYGDFARRYVGKETTTLIVNSDKNLQLMNASDNSSKKDKTARQFIDMREKQVVEIEKKIDELETNLQKTGLSDGQKAEIKKKIADKKAESSKAGISEEGKKALVDNEKEAKKSIHESFVEEGAKSVTLEQVGRVLEVLVGPMSFEIRDMIANGFEHGVDGDNALKALWVRICRMMRYLAKELPKLLGDFCADLGQMLTHLAMSIFGIVKQIFGKFFDLVVNGLSTIKEAIKILSSKQYKTSAEKADAIAKLLITLTTAVVGQFLIDMGLNALGIVDPWSEIIAALVSSVLSSVVVCFFNKLDLFGVQSDVRRARIEEIFDARIEAIKKNTAQFDVAVTEKLRVQRIQFEKCRIKITESLQQKDFLSVTETLNDAAKFFAVDIPYSTSEEFVRYVRGSSAIKIAVS